MAALGTMAGSGTGGAIGRTFAHATRPSWWILAGLALTIAALGYLTTTPRAIDTARRTNERLQRRSDANLARLHARTPRRPRASGGSAA